MKKLLAVFALVMLSGLVSAMDYQIKNVQVLPVESYPSRVTIGAVTVAADPYPTDEKTFTAFDIKDLNSKGYNPVHIIIQNSSPEFVSLKIRNVVLVTEGGQELYTTSATLVVQDVVKAGFVSKLPKMKSHDAATSTKSGSPLLDFTGKELSNRQIEPGTVSAGFIFFYNQEPKKPFFKGAKIMIPQIIVEGSRRILGPFVIPLDPALEGSAARPR
jgi:hypothetical protein